MITHQRLEYTKQALTALLESNYHDLEIVVWDNASTDGTRQWLVEHFASDPRVSIVLSNRNLGVAHPMNVVWGTAQTPLVAKIDNDTLIPADLLQRLAELHFANPSLGVISGCHFRPEDLELEATSVVPKILNIETKLSLLRQKHVGGCAVMMRRSLFEKSGKIPVRRPPDSGPFLEAGWTDYQHHLHNRGFANGYPLPLIFVDHMEDTRSSHHFVSLEHEQYKLAMRGQGLADYTNKFYVAGGQSLVADGTIEVLERKLSPKALLKGEVTLFIPLAGRAALWPQLSGYLERQTLARVQTKLILLDTSHDKNFSKLVKQWVANCDYTDVRVIVERVGLSGLADLPRRDVTPAVRKSMAQIYNRLRWIVDSEFVWILEDDILPPDDVCQRLLVSFTENVQSVAAPYRSRFGERYVTWDPSGKNFTARGQGLKIVGGNGFGCVVIRSGAITKFKFDPGQDCDRQFYEGIARSKSTSLVDWTCECHHGLLPPSESIAFGAGHNTLNEEPSIA